MDQPFPLVNKNSEDIASLKTHNELTGTTIQQIIEKQKEIESKVFDCSTYLIKTLQILERIVPAVIIIEPIKQDDENKETVGDFSLTEAITALEKLRDI